MKNVAQTAAKSQSFDPEKYEGLIAQGLESMLGKERFMHVKELKFGDTIRLIIGKDQYGDQARFLDDHLLCRDCGFKSGNEAARLLRKGLHTLAEQTYYGFLADAVAQNIVSLPYILNDKFVARKSWVAALWTRANAAVGNTLTGRAYGAWQDYVIATMDKWLNTRQEKNKVKKFMKGWAEKTTAFVTGQSWLYAIYLKVGDMLAGQETDYSGLLAGVITLSIAAPLLGPISDAGYQYVRKQFGLPPVPDYRQGE